MADYLLYWKHFWKDSQTYPIFDEQWHTGQRSFYNQVQRGDNLWVVISGAPKSPEWRLLTKIKVSNKKFNSRFGRPYGVYGKKETSLRFDFESQKDFESMLKKLQFNSGKKIYASGREIGIAIQKIRRLSDEDKQLLNNYSKTLKRHTNDFGYKGEKRLRGS